MLGRTNAWSVAALLITFCILQVQPLVLRLPQSAESCSKLTNKATHYTVETGVGTPQQKFDLIIDTGSNAVIVQSCLCREITEECQAWEKCFVGGNKSSTFIPPKPKSHMLLLSFGSGDIIAAVATDIVHVGSVSATMKKGFLLMVNRKLPGVFDFEGILGLGLPSWAESKAPAVSSEPDPAKDALVKTGFLDLKTASRPKNDTVVPPPRFLEMAHVNMFSICFVPGADGALRLNQAEMPDMLNQIGHRHWSLSLQGLSAGSSSAAITVCDPAVAPCAAVPDSGTTHIMGPKEDVRQILGELCSQWKRCEEFKSRQQVSSELAFRAVLHDCENWMTPERGISEVPSLFLHLASADGQTRVLEITAMSYVYSEWQGSGQLTCAPSFGEWTFKTKNHGVAWILGTPLFYEYQVGFRLRPASIGFSKVPCDLCSTSSPNSTAMVVKKGLPAVNSPRIMNGKARLPNIDVNEEL